MSDIILFHLAESLHHWLHANLSYMTNTVCYLEISGVAGLPV